jgi:hypothetical protein
LRRCNAATPIEDSHCGANNPTSAVLIERPQKMICSPKFPLTAEQQFESNRVIEGEGRLTTSV